MGLGSAGPADEKGTQAEGDHNLRPHHSHTLEGVGNVAPVKL